MPEKTISLCLIVRDSAKTLRHCLETFKPAVNEIVVVDTGSTDDTKAIAAEFGAVIYDYKWINDFSAARNFALQKCTQEWVLWVDSDDWIKPSEVQKIKEFDFTPWDVIVAIYNYSHDGHGNCTCSNPRERFLRRALIPDRIKFEGRIHETVSLDPTKYRVGVSDIHTEHDKRESSSSRNLEILRLCVRDNPKDTRSVYYLAKELYDAGQHEESIKWFDRAVLRKDLFWEDRYLGYFYLAHAYLYARKDKAAFKKLMFKSIDLEDRRAEPFFAIGLYWQTEGEFQRAIPWYNYCLDVKRPNNLLAPSQPEYYTYLPHMQLTVCHNAIGEVREAYIHNCAAMEYRPKDESIIKNDKILRAYMAEHGLSLPEIIVDNSTTPTPQLVVASKNENEIEDGIPAWSGIPT